MYGRSAKFYDACYAFKDYKAELGRLRAMMQPRVADGATLLDVACGTGTHLELLREFYRVEGLDINPEMIELARKKCPGVTFHCGDMLTFDLGRRFDVVTCLFSSIVYVQTVENMRRAVANMGRHVSDGGMLLVDPWVSPSDFWEDRVTMNVVDRPESKIVWMYASRRVGLTAVLDINYLIGTAAGVEHFEERHTLGLFPREDYAEAFQAAGFSCEWDAAGLFGRGMFVGKRL
jgi:ubiquinone/menaquinone biosynthesis C-methylase UbiE